MAAHRITEVWSVNELAHRIEILDEIGNSFESAYDKHEPRLILCDYCKKEALLPG